MVRVPTWMMFGPGTISSSMRRRIGVVWVARCPNSSSWQSGCASKWMKVGTPE
jgi:hypothetical protein